MVRLTDGDIEAIARRIAGDIVADATAAASGVRPHEVPVDGPGLFASVDEAVKAAAAAQPVFVALPLTVRARILASIRATMLANVEVLARAAYDETGLGRYEDKVVKNRLVTERTPGLEELYPQAVTGDHGLTLTEPAPFGVIGAITPSTNPTSTIICNALGMLAAGNTVVFCVHPLARQCSMMTVTLLNKAIVQAGGPRNVVTCHASPSIEVAQEVMRHPGIRLLVVTGGGAVVKAAMASGKRAICAGPGNPPVVVDETAHIDKAARDILLGASTDNNIICVDEKEVFVVASVADRLVQSMVGQGAILLDNLRLRQVENLVFARHPGPRGRGSMNHDVIGKDISVILSRIGMNVPPSARLAIADVDEQHPLLWSEQM
ncbi:MAG: aldehyde dehydrogenase, partial [Vicinamibacterales bacterium]|nr:aldehyde dehydrogenase [Vicinamibacterales bacterium]